MHPHYIVKQPIVTEKSTFAMNEHRQYAFLVDRRATKDEIKLAVEKLYKVRVVDVKTQNRKGRLRRYRYGTVQEPTTKKALVRLHEKDVIDLF